MLALSWPPLCFACWPLLIQLHRIDRFQPKTLAEQQDRTWPIKAVPCFGAFLQQQTAFHSNKTLDGQFTPATSPSCHSHRCDEAPGWLDSCSVTSPGPVTSPPRSSTLLNISTSCTVVQAVEARTHASAQRRHGSSSHLLAMKAGGPAIPLASRWSPESC